MSTKATWTVVFLAIVSLLAANTSAAEKVDKQTAKVVAGNNAFALELYRQLDDKPGNLFFSPYSISTALAMTYGGARGETEKQMAQVLHFPAGQAPLHKSFAALQKGLIVEGDKTPYRLSIANRLWGQSGFDFLPEYLALTRKSYDAPLQELDFAGQTEPSRATINQWVEDQTQGKIKDLMPSGSITSDTRLVLTNAIYFMGNWVYQFPKKATRPAPFYLSAEKKVMTPTMFQKRIYGYSETEQIQVLHLPYKGKRLEMVVLLPKEKNGLSKLEQSLTAKNLNAWLKTITYNQVQVYLPKFKLTSNFNMEATFRDLGMTLPFTKGAADFSGMNGHRNLYISAVMHKAFVDVNERGTEAAAATGVAVTITSLQPKPVVFRADHPFLFLIRDKQTGSILFMGRLTDPGK